MARGFARLSSPQRRILAQALVMLPATAVALRLFGYRRLLHRISRQSAARRPGADEDAALELARQIASPVEIAARRGPFHASCVERSLVLHGLLRQRGLKSEICLGVSRDRPGQGGGERSAAGFVVDDSRRRAALGIRAQVESVDHAVKAHRVAFAKVDLERREAGVREAEGGFGVALPEIPGGRFDSQSLDAVA